MLDTLVPETQREWELINAYRADTTKNAEMVTILESSSRVFVLLYTTQTMKVVPNISRSSQITGKKCY